MGGLLMAETGTLGETAADRELLSWLTLERAAYGGAIVLALLLRLLLLGAWPLGPAEAAQALPALAASTGREFDLIGTSPLLFGLQMPLFAVFGASDAWARVWPAVLGGLAPLLFKALARPLGRGGALVAAYLWALSPMAVFSSRLGLGYSLVPIFALAIVSFVTWSMTADSLRTQRLALTIAAGALGLLLASGQGAYTVLLMAVPAVIIWRRSIVTLCNVLRDCWKQAASALVLSFAFGLTCFSSHPAVWRLPQTWLAVGSQDYVRGRASTRLGRLDCVFCWANLCCLALDWRASCGRYCEGIVLGSSPACLQASPFSFRLSGVDDTPPIWELLCWLLPS